MTVIAKGVYCRNGLPHSQPSIFYPLNTDLFVKHINLTNNQRVKIGRQTETQTVPAENMPRCWRKVARRVILIACYYLSWRLISCSGSVSETSKARTARSLTVNDSAKKGSRANTVQIQVGRYPSRTSFHSFFIGSLLTSQPRNALSTL
jgi:hypothetical protein